MHSNAIKKALYESVEVMSVKKPRRLLCVMLVLLIVIGSLTGVFAVFAAEDAIEPNKTMFENTINNRSWIIDTLVEDDLSTNPMAYVLNVSDGFLDEVVDNYQKSGAYKLLVDAFDTSENASAYITQWTETAIAAILYDLGQISSDELLMLVDEEIQSVDNRRYSAILTDIFSENYTSSWGTKLLEEETMAQLWSDLNDSVETISNYRSFLKSNLDLFYGDYRTGTYDTDTFISEFNDYTDDFLKINEEMIKESGADLGLHLYWDADEGTSEERRQKAFQKLRGMTLSTALALGEGYTPVNLLRNGNIKTRANNALTTSMPKGLKNGLKLFGAALDGASTFLEYATLLTHMFNQYDTTVAAMQRLRSHATSQDMRNAVDDILSLYEEGDTWEDYALACLRDVIKNNKTIGKTILQKGSKLLSKAWEYSPSAKSLASSALTAGAIKNLVKLGKAVSIGVWIGDKLTDIKTSAKKVYVAKFTKKLISAAVATYRADYNTYLSDRTEENARNCINDLQFIKRLRLYGEKQAFESTTAMTDSILGLILTSISNGEDARDYMEKRHKAYNDALLGCVAVPDQNGSFTIENGYELRIGTDIFENGKYITVARYYDADGKLKKTIPEADWLLGTHLTLNGGTLTIANGYDPNGICPVFLQLDAKGGTVNIGSNGVYFGNLIVSKETQINIANPSAEVLVSQLFKNTSTLTVSGGRITTYDLENTGTVNMSDREVEVRGQLSNSSTINGSILITGYQDSPFTIGMMEASKPEVISTGVVAKLSFNSSYKEGVKISGSQTVTEYLNTNRTRIRTGENLTVSENCVIANNTANCSLSFNNFTATAPLTLNGYAKIKGTVDLAAGGTFNDGIELTSNCQSLTLGGDTTVKGEFLYNGGTVVGNGNLKLMGDMTVGVSSPDIEKLDFIGSSPQTITSSKTLTVSELNNHNSSRGGVSFDSRIYVTDMLSAGYTRNFANGKNIVLTGSADVTGETIKGTVSAENWTVPGNITINGTLYATGDMVVPADTSLHLLGYSQNSGTLTIGENARLYVDGDWSCGAAVTNAGELVATGMFFQSKALTGGTVSVGDDVECSCELKPDTLLFFGKMSQQFTNNGETTVKNMAVNNTSRSGVAFNSLVTVSESYSSGSGSVRVQNGDNIRLTYGGVLDLPTDLGGSVTLNGSYVTGEGKRLEIGGSLTLNSGAEITVSAGSTLTVGRSLTDSGGTITIEPGGKLLIRDYMNVTSGTVTNDGEITVKGDAALSGTVGGSGVYILKGDLNAGGTWNSPNLRFDSKLPQYVTGSSFKVNDLTIDNSSLTGIDIQTTIKYSGSLTTGASTVTGDEKLVKQ